MPVLAAISIFSMHVHEEAESVHRDPWNPAPWLNIQESAMPFKGRENWFYSSTNNFIAGRGFEDGRNDGVYNIDSEHH